MVNLYVTDYIQFAFAALLLSNLIYVSLFLFTETNPNKKNKEKIAKEYGLQGFRLFNERLFAVDGIHFFLRADEESLFAPLKPILRFQALAVLAI